MLTAVVQIGYAGPVHRSYWMCKALARLLLPKNLLYQDLSQDRRLLLGLHHLLDHCLRIRHHFSVHPRLDDLDGIRISLRLEMLQGDTVLLHLPSYGCGLGCGYPHSAAANALAIADAHKTESGRWADVAAGRSVS